MHPAVIEPGKAGRRARGLLVLLVLAVVPAAAAAGSGGRAFVSDIRERVLAGGARSWLLTGNVTCRLFPEVVLFSGSACLPDAGDSALLRDGIRLYCRGMILHAAQGSFNRSTGELRLEEAVVFAPGREWWGCRAERVVIAGGFCRLTVAGREHVVVLATQSGSGSRSRSAGGSP